MRTTQREFPGFKTFSEIYEEAAKHMSAAIMAYFAGNKEAVTNELVNYASATMTARKLEKTK